MENLERLSRKISTAHDLLSVVKTMKSLAAVNIRQFEKAARSMIEYNKVIDFGWQALFRKHTRIKNGKSSSTAVCLVLGSDQGMCGQFNDAIVQYAIKEISSLHAEGIQPRCWTAGERIRPGLDEEIRIDQYFPLPSSIVAISDMTVAIVQEFAVLHETQHVDMLLLYYNSLGRRGMYEPVSLQVLPFDRKWSQQHKKATWPSRCLPVVGMGLDAFFEHIFQQHIFASIYRAFAQSLASESAARLSAMQTAEKNILEQQEYLQGRYRDLRQGAITAELLDIISGFEALKPP
jgi:F-type H+-transporting ATPase subunit gamma